MIELTLEMAEKAVKAAQAMGGGGGTGEQDHLCAEAGAATRQD
jgi:hypothetical protein